MLLLTRRLNEIVDIGDGIEVMVTEIRDERGRTLYRGSVVLGITAPPDVPVNRREVRDRMVKEHGRAIALGGADV